MNNHDTTLRYPLTSAEVCELLDVSRPAITDLISRRKLKAPRKRGAFFAWEPEDVEALRKAIEHRGA